MCISVVVNKKKTIVGWNLDLRRMEARIRIDEKGVYIEVNDPADGWLPLLGANSRGDFVGMPTCWPFDSRSEPAEGKVCIMYLDMDFLMQRKTMEEVRAIAESGMVCSGSGLTFMGALSDGNGNVLHIIPGQGCLYYEKPEYKLLTNFSPFKGNSETHRLMGWERYQKAEAILENAAMDFDVSDCFELLKETSQEVCPTVVSMVYDVSEKTVCWCENRIWDIRYTYVFRRYETDAEKKEESDGKGSTCQR